ncbi:MAG TPA: hypothetical protein VEP67_11360 [Thiobacillaceae bacterium]|nr:hypothetical protein [Thiobacillaceae bacterium]
MHNLETFLAYSPRGAGLLCAVVYAEKGDDVFGWLTGNRAYQMVSAYFLLKGFYSAGESLFYATEGMDLRGGWKYDYSTSEPELARPLLLDEGLALQLDAMQGKFVGEWLFYQENPDSVAEIEAYKELGLPLQTVNVQAKKLNKFDQGDAVWRHYSAAFRHPVLRFLSARWPLDYRVD